MTIRGLAHTIHQLTKRTLDDWVCKEELQEFSSLDVDLKPLTTSSGHSDRRRSVSVQGLESPFRAAAGPGDANSRI